MRTPLRRLQGITYWVIEDSTAIRTFLDTNVRREWEADARNEEGPPYDHPWLTEVAWRRWRLATLALRRIQPKPRLMTYTDPRSGSSFAAELAPRSRELRRAIQEHGAVIWPLVMRGEDLRLMDGYCRYTALRDLRVGRVYAYVGRLAPRASNTKPRSRG